MSRPVSVLFRRVSPGLLDTARKLVPAAAAIGAEVTAAEDVLRLAVEVGLVTLGCAVPPKPEKTALALVVATLEARVRHPNAASLTAERSADGMVVVSQGVTYVVAKDGSVTRNGEAVRADDPRITLTDYRALMRAHQALLGEA